MDYQALKLADAVLGVADLQSAADALNAQRATVVGDIATTDARGVLLLSGEWFKVKQLAKSPLTGGSMDQVIAAADICIDTLSDTTTLHTSDPAQWAVMQQMIGGLIQAGVVSAASFDKWKALRSAGKPVWAETVTPGHIQTARAQP